MDQKATFTIDSVMGRRKYEANSGFGERLIALRRLRNMTQVQLAEAAGTTQRAISYYETTGNYPPAPALIELARALLDLMAPSDLVGAEQFPEEN